MPVSTVKPDFEFITHINRVCECESDPHCSSVEGATIPNGWQCQDCMLIMCANCKESHRHPDQVEGLDMCESCQSPARACWWCTDCSMFLCLPCAKTHDEDGEHFDIRAYQGEEKEMPMQSNEPKLQNLLEGIEFPTPDEKAREVFNLLDARLRHHARRFELEREAARAICFALRDRLKDLSDD